MAFLPPSSALEILEKIERNSSLRLAVYDPHVKHFDYELSGLEAAFKDSDCILLAVDHAEFKYINPKQVANIMRTRNVIDTKNALSRKDWMEAGFNYRLLGRDYDEKAQAVSKVTMLEEPVLVTV